ncbi:MAG: tRNA (guanosine(37)-N1)-methyltransferase TrmD [Verrucomicrobiota bacterium]|nr:tRNA (guanosine(37)-N1)-methyltransferase TrmD [Verrucomicrobiota bacterium]
MRIDYITLFPEAFKGGPLGVSIVNRAIQEGKVEINIVNLRDYTHDAHRSVDDAPYGGGAGMLMKVEPIFEAVESLKTDDCRVVLLTPQGNLLTHQTAVRMSTEKHIIFICGHYEGVDERVRKFLVDEEISIGNYVLTNGNLPAMVVTDALIRHIPGVLGSKDSLKDESFSNGDLLEYPQYTRPAEYRGMSVPEVLLSGNHGVIEQWRYQQTVLRTEKRRSDA